MYHPTLGMGLVFICFDLCLSRAISFLSCGHPHSIFRDISSIKSIQKDLKILILTILHNPEAHLKTTVSRFLAKCLVVGPGNYEAIMLIDV